MSDHYRWAGGIELVHRIGSHRALQTMIIPPLFEEANRTRKLLFDTMRGLEAHGIGSTLIDLPGNGESLTPLSDLTFNNLCDAAFFACETFKPVVVASLRGGTLLDHKCAAVGKWRFAPETGSRIVRDIKRAQLTTNVAGEVDMFAGQRVSPAFLEALAIALPAPSSSLRVVRLDSDTADADAKVTGIPLWRRAEPGEDAVLANALAADLAGWTKQCAAS